MLDTDPRKHCVGEKSLYKQRGVRSVEEGNTNRYIDRTEFSNLVFYS